MSAFGGKADIPSLNRGVLSDSVLARQGPQRMPGVVRSSFWEVWARPAFPFSLGASPYTRQFRSFCPR